MEDLLADSLSRAARYLSQLDSRTAVPTPQAIAGLHAFDESLPEQGSDPREVLRLLDEAGSPATVASAGGRYFGFVTGGVLPVALAANWLAGAWDQNGALQALSPVAAKLEEVAMEWLKQILHLPAASGIGFVTGATMANFSCLAAARHALLARQGWDVEAQGLCGAPPITVVVGAEVHVALLKALALLGFGRSRVVRVPVDAQGRMRAEALPDMDDHTLLCIQAGNVNTGAFDPAPHLCRRAAGSGAWVHVDGAFGLWAAASPQYAFLTDGFELADSWAVDCHKSLNVPHDSGLAIVRDPQHLRAALSVRAAYLQVADTREPSHFTPEASRRARGVEVWAVLRCLGRDGVARLIARQCEYARLFGRLLGEAGYSILNEVVFNQVLVSFGEPALSRRILAEVQAEGTCWCGGTEWQGQTAMRISVSSWATTEEDVRASASAIVRIARAQKEKAALV